MKVRNCIKCGTSVQLVNNAVEFQCGKCGARQAVDASSLRARVRKVRQEGKSAATVNAMSYGRESFSRSIAPQTQYCSCDCRQRIQKGQEVFSRPFVPRSGKITGQTRLIDLEDHFDRWFEKVAHLHARKVAAKNKRVARMLGEDLNGEASY